MMMMIFSSDDDGDLNLEQDVADRLLARGEQQLQNDVVAVVGVCMCAWR